jgi:hypothetical protein
LTSCAVRKNGVAMQTSGVLSQLRKLRPARRLSRIEARKVAEQQAARLLRLRGGLDLPVAEEVITHLPRLSVDRQDLGSLSGLSHWDGGYWRIAVNGRHAMTRQRFTIAHEFAHILDAPFQRYVRPEHAEEVADCFAAALLMPKPLVKRTWAQGVQRAPALARRFDVSPAAMRWRLDELRLGDPVDLPLAQHRCGGVASESQLQAFEGSHERQHAY